MGRYFYKGLKFEITLLFSVVFILINVVFGRVTYRYFKAAYVDSYNKYLYTRAQTVINRTELNPNLIALPDSGESIRVFYHNYQQQAVIAFQSPGVISQLILPVKPGIVDSLGQHGVYLKKDEYDGRPVELLLTISNAPLEKKLNKLSLLMMVATLVSVLLSAIAAYLSAGWLLRPIRSIAKQATQINTNKLSARLTVTPTHDELQQLAETINDMLGRIEREQQLQNNFFAAASHELRTPLANLQAETELHLGDSNNQQLLTSQLQEITRLQQIVEQFLLISQFKHKGLVINKGATDLTDQLLQVFARNRFMAERRQLKTTIHFDNNVPSFSVNADADKLEVVWQNLLQNALKYAVAGSTIICKVAQAENGLSISMENEIMQASMNTQNLTDAFTPDQSITSGSGLGLWLCKQIIAAHQGSLTLASSNYQFKATVNIPF